MKKHHAHYQLTAFFVVVGIALSFSASRFVADYLSDRAEHQLRDLNRLSANTLKHALESDIAKVNSIVSLYKSSDFVERGDFPRR